MAAKVKRLEKGIFFTVLSIVIAITGLLFGNNLIDRLFGSKLIKNIVDTTGSQAPNNFIDTNYIPIYFNDGPDECANVSIANYTTQEGVSRPCWDRTSIIASDNDIINIGIYFHNTGVADIPLLAFRITDPRGTIIPPNGTITLRGEILYNGEVISTGNVRLVVSGGPMYLDFGQVAFYTQSQGSDNLVHNGMDILSAEGLSMGPLSPGWDYQGEMMCSFRVRKIPPS